jgi:hypothetical protein
MANLSNKTVSLREDIFRGTTPLRVDRELGVIHGAKLLGVVSSNGRTYTLAGIRKAAGLYEGKVVNIDHRAKPNQPRSAHDRFGRVVNVVVKDDGLYGDVEYLRSHPMADRVAEAAERMPGIYGMSHDAWGEGNNSPGKKATVIESITNVNSVDLVCDPATVKGLFEQEESGMEPNGTGASTSPEEQLKAGFRGAMVAVLDDESMDMGGKLAKLKEIMKAQEKIMGGGESKDESPAEEKPAEEPAKEQAEVKDPDPWKNAEQLQEQVEQFRRKETVRTLCDQAGLLPSAIQLKALVALTEQADVKALVQQFKGIASNGQKPKSTTPGQHLTEGQAKATDGKTLAAALLKRRR